MVLRLAAVVITLLSGVIAFLIISAFAHTMKRQILANEPLATATPTPAALSVTWSCPAPAEGWTATLIWAPGASVVSDWLVETAPSLDGPWGIAGTGLSGQPQLQHLAPGQSEWVRAGSADDLETPSHLLTDGVLTAPHGC